MNISGGFFWEKPEGLAEFERTQKMLRELVEPYEAMRQSVIENAAMALNQFSCLPEINQANSVIGIGILEAIKRESDSISRIASIADGLNVSVDRMGEWSKTILGKINEMSCIMEPSILDGISKFAGITSLMDGLEMDDGESLEDDSSYLLTEEEQKIIAADIDEILSEEENWEQRLFEKINAYKKAHPILARLLIYLFMGVILPIIAQLFGNLIGEALIPAKVYEEPQIVAPVICRLEQHQNVLIIGEVPYYYQIETKDLSTNETKTGFVSKRSIEVEKKS